MAAVRALLIDDEELILRAFRRHLVRAGHEVLTALSAEDALELLDRIDVIISDVRLPGMSGVDLLLEVRGRGLTTPVILMTGDADPREAARVRALGAIYLSKPFETSSLLDLVEMYRPA